MEQNIILYVNVALTLSRIKIVYSNLFFYEFDESKKSRNVKINM